MKKTVSGKFPSKQNGTKIKGHTKENGWREEAEQREKTGTSGVKQNKERKQECVERSRIKRGTGGIRQNMERKWVERGRTGWNEAE